MIRSLITPLLALALLGCSEKQDAPPPKAPPRSEQLAQSFPLLPMLEAKDWQKLITEEESLDDAQSEEERNTLANSIDKIARRLQERHPFSETETSTSLGGITYDKASHEIAINARVRYPREGDERHPGELELILCSTTGRAHETLFITDARPLHLELLLHLVGYTKGSNSHRFHVDIETENGSCIPVERLLKPKESDKLPTRLSWEFSGADFDDLYSPDQTGDFILCWHAHPSVLRVHHQGIASGEVKLLAVPHEQLTQGQAVTIVITPQNGEEKN